MTFDPEGTFTKDSSIFGMPKNTTSKLELLPVAWEPTTSFKKGTALGAEAIFEATKQMDLFHPYFKKAYKGGISWNERLLEETKKLNDETSKETLKIISKIENNEEVKKSELDFVNTRSKQLNTLVYEASKKDSHTLGLVGGDHSSPFGLIKALSEKHNGDFSIVHIDAHFDFRNEYQDFEFSHASIMHNVRTKLKNPPGIFQLGIRDFCESEYKFAMNHSTFLLDQELHQKLFNGKSFKHCLDELFENLKENIYISFDIDGMSPEFCPHTGTPVPGGLTYNQSIFLIQYLHEKGHKLIGFDLVEVSPDTTTTSGEGLDEIIAARVLYELSCFALTSST